MAKDRRKLPFCRLGGVAQFTNCQSPRRHILFDASLTERHKQGSEIVPSDELCADPHLDMVLGHTSMQRDTIALSVALRAESMVAFECRPAAFFNLRDDQSVAARQHFGEIIRSRSWQRE
jgi:hypothetical protein